MAMVASVVTGAEGTSPGFEAAWDAEGIIPGGATAEGIRPTGGGAMVICVG